VGSGNDNQIIHPVEPQSKLPRAKKSLAVGSSVYQYDLQELVRVEPDLPVAAKHLCDSFFSIGSVLYFLSVLLGRSSARVQIWTLLNPSGNLLSAPKLSGSF
jgi:hypothetical protein